MADIAKILLPDGETYDIKDATARAAIDTLSASTWYGTSSTSAGTRNKVVTCAGYTLEAGRIIAVMFSTANTYAAPRLNVNSTGALDIYVGSAVASGTTNVCKWLANTLVYFMYDGTRYRYLGQAPGAPACRYGTCSTEEDTAAKVVACSDYRLQTGAIISVNCSAANTVAGAITLNVNSTGAKGIMVNGELTSVTPLLWDAGEQLTFMYDGTQYVLIARSNPAAGTIIQSSTTFSDTAAISSDQGTRTVTRQGNRVHMDWGANYTTTSGSWKTIATLPEGYRPLTLQRRTFPLFISLTGWPGYGLAEVSTEGVIRIGCNVSGTAVWEICFDYDVVIP